MPISLLLGSIEVNPETANEKEFSDTELALLNLIAEIIVDISIREANEQDKEYKDEA
ncbi:hypothetical protein SAMN04488511_11631 [Pedobacter suwonensis]|uniref:GAF domain-containing protein n=1 Tax=Pedobacter suwonensis TaxID=332999 RepID=A0A1I0U065_9SPHI|nr:hypothetical protein [Pedobacter suwonensis]SFA56536.1 hypothetical protein SAMN04488511_11631 [Pedobacter suwonensis]